MRGSKEEPIVVEDSDEETWSDNDDDVIVVVHSPCVWPIDLEFLRPHTLSEDEFLNGFTREVLPTVHALKSTLYWS